MVSLKTRGFRREGERPEFVHGKRSRADDFVRLAFERLFFVGLCLAPRTEPRRARNSAMRAVSGRGGHGPRADDAAPDVSETSRDARRRRAPQTPADRRRRAPLASLRASASAFSRIPFRMNVSRRTVPTTPLVVVALHPVPGDAEPVEDPAKLGVAPALPSARRRSGRAWTRLAPRAPAARRRRATPAAARSARPSAGHLRQRGGHHRGRPARRRGGGGGGGCTRRVYRLVAGSPAPVPSMRSRVTRATSASPPSRTPITGRRTASDPSRHRLCAPLDPPVVRARAPCRAVPPLAPDAAAAAAGRVPAPPSRSASAANAAASAARETDPPQARGAEGTPAALASLDASPRAARVAFELARRRLRRRRRRLALGGARL